MNRLFLISLAAVLCASSLTALAGPYSDAVAKQSKCESAGKLAMAFHGTTVEELRRELKKIDEQARARKISKKLAGDTQYILFMGNNAKSPKDAYMEAWAWCMDKK